MGISFEIIDKQTTLDDLITILPDLLDNERIEPNSIKLNDTLLLHAVCKENRLDILRTLLEDERLIQK